jgi:hypothetical protein
LKTWQTSGVGYVRRGLGGMEREGRGVGWERERYLERERERFREKGRGLERERFREREREGGEIAIVLANSIRWPYLTKAAKAEALPHNVLRAPVVVHGVTIKQDNVIFLVVTARRKLVVTFHFNDGQRETR